MDPRWTYEEAFARNEGLVSAAEQEKLRRSRGAIAGLGGLKGLGGEVCGAPARNPYLIGFKVRRRGAASRMTGMNALRITPFALLAALGASACSGEAPQPSTSTSSTTSTGAGGGAATGGTATGGAATGGAGGALPTGCPETLPAPQDCGEFADWCGNATPIAAGGELTFATGSVPTTSHVWFAAAYSNLGPCSGFFYRVPKGGGDAQRMLATDRIIAFEAEDDALYLVERTDDPSAVSIGVLVGDQRQTLGEIHGKPGWNGSYEVALAPTPGGIVTYDRGSKNSSLSKVTLGGLTPIPADMPEGYLGSLPAYDGQHLFLTISDSPYISTNGALWDRSLVRVSASAPVLLGTNAHAEAELQIVAVDADSVFFVTGGPSNADGPMGISRVAKTGGAATPLFPPGTISIISQVLVDDTDVYFRGIAPGLALGGIWAVSKAGGSVRRIWGGKNIPTSNVRMDAQNLYFSVDGRKNKGEITGPGGTIVRIAKSASFP